VTQPWLRLRVQAISDTKTEAASQKGRRAHAGLSEEEGRPSDSPAEVTKASMSRRGGAPRQRWGLAVKSSTAPRWSNRTMVRGSPRRRRDFTELPGREVQLHPLRSVPPSGFGTAGAPRLPRRRMPSEFA
jgi:hypothetical protein